MTVDKIHIAWLSVAMLASSAVLGGPYPPRAGVAGSTAIAASDSSFVSWADTVVDIQYGVNVIETFRTPEKALGAAAGTSFDIVSLGSGGTIVLSFPNGIGDGDGYDFAVFENSFSDTFLELAYVEVSTNGTDYVRFPNVSLTTYPVSQYGTVDPSDVDGLAGKYRQGYGVPFDLADLAGISENLNLARVLYVRLIDVVGDGSCLDSSGHAIYDPHPGQDSAGFDLDAVGVIHEGEAAIAAEVSLKHEGFAYSGPVSGAGQYEIGETVSWSVSSPWPGENGENGHRWVAEVSSGSFVVETDTVVTVSWREQVLLTIESDYAEAAGGGWYDIGSTVAWSVPSMVLATGGQTRHRVSSASSGQVTLDDSKVISVVWATEHFLQVCRLGDGIVTPASGFYGGGVDLSAADLVEGGDTVFTFVRWEVDGVAVAPSNRDLNLPMDAPKTVAAVFELNDALPVVEVSGTLLPGWNLIESPLHLQDGFRDSVFGQDSGIEMFGWEPGCRRYLSKTMINRGVGCWASAKSTTPYTWRGVASQSVNPLVSGWNLVGGSTLAADILSTTTVWAWQPDIQMYRAAKEISPGVAYWVYSE